MYFIHEFKWEPSKFTHSRILPGYNTHAEARLVLRSLEEERVPHVSYEIKEEKE